MDQKKIGAFIAQCRKEKSLTQIQLAELLDITSNIVGLKKFPIKPTANSITATSNVTLEHVENKYFIGLRLAICFSL